MVKLKLLLGVTYEIWCKSFQKNSINVHIQLVDSYTNVYCTHLIIDKPPHYVFQSPGDNLREFHLPPEDGLLVIKTRAQVNVNIIL